MFSLEKRRLRGDPITVQNLLVMGRREGREMLISSFWYPALANGLQLCQGKFRLDNRIKLFTERVVQYCNRLLRQGIMALSLLLFKKHWENAFEFRA